MTTENDGLIIWIAEHVMGWKVYTSPHGNINCIATNDDDRRTLVHKHGMALRMFNPTIPGGDVWEVFKACAKKLPIHIELMTDGKNWWVARPDMDSGETIMHESPEMAVCLFAQKLFSE